MLRVVTPSRTDEYINCLLESLEASQPGSAKRVVVADNGISEQYRYFWTQHGVTFVPVPSDPFIFARAINLGVAATQPDDDLLILNDDTEMLTPLWADTAETMLRRVGLRNYGMLSLSISAKENVGNHDQALDVNLNPNGGVKESMKTICFVAVVIRRSTWDAVGPMDERFVGYGFDDNDYNCRIWNSKKRVGIVSTLVVKHGKTKFPFSSSFARYNSMEKLNEMFNQNKDLMNDKYVGGKF